MICCESQESIITASISTQSPKALHLDLRRTSRSRLWALVHLLLDTRASENSAGNLHWILVLSSIWPQKMSALHVSGKAVVSSLVKRIWLCSQCNTKQVFHLQCYWSSNNKHRILHNDFIVQYPMFIVWRPITLQMTDDPGNGWMFLGVSVT